VDPGLHPDVTRGEVDVIYARVAEALPPVDLVDQLLHHPSDGLHHDLPLVPPIHLDEETGLGGQFGHLLRPSLSRSRGVGGKLLNPEDVAAFRLPGCPGVKGEENPVDRD